LHSYNLCSLKYLSEALPSFRPPPLSSNLVPASRRPLGGGELEGFGWHADLALLTPLLCGRLHGRRPQLQGHQPVRRSGEYLLCYASPIRAAQPQAAMKVSSICGDLALFIDLTCHPASFAKASATMQSDAHLLCLISTTITLFLNLPPPVPLRRGGGAVSCVLCPVSCVLWFTPRRVTT